MKRLTAIFATAAILMTLLLWYLVLPRRALGVAFGGPGYFISRNACVDITGPVVDSSICWDVTNRILRRWDGAAWSGIFTSWTGSNTGNNTLTAGATEYMPIWGDNLWAAGALADAAQMVPFGPARATQLHCGVTGALGGGHSVAFTLMASALPTPLAATGLTCTITDPATTCGDTTHFAALTIGWAMYIQSVSSAGVPGGIHAMCSFAVD